MAQNKILQESSQKSNNREWAHMTISAGKGVAIIRLCGENFHSSSMFRFRPIKTIGTIRRTNSLVNIQSRPPQKLQTHFSQFGGFRNS